MCFGIFRTWDGLGVHLHPSTRSQVAKTAYVDIWTGSKYNQISRNVGLFLFIFLYKMKTKIISNHIADILFTIEYR